MKPDRSIQYSDAEFTQLGEYIASRADLKHATFKQIEVALKDAGKLPQGDHLHAAFRTWLKAISIRHKRA